MKIHKVGSSVAGFVFDEQGRTIMQHRTGSHGADTWCPPGGKLDYGEHPEEAFQREVKEEIDLNIKDLKCIGFTNDVFPDDKLHFVTTWYVSRLASGIPKIMEPHKCIALEWRALNDMPAPLFQPTNDMLNSKEMMQKVKAYLEGPTT